MERVVWSKCEANTWCPFWGINLKHKYFNELEGIYIIWYENVTVVVGEGSIRERFKVHIHEKEFEAFKTKYLLVTWCTVSSSLREGVANYLCSQYHPLIARVCPDSTPIAVNLPFSRRSIYLYGSTDGNSKNISLR